MLRVRDELKMTLMAYQTLYESSIAFGIRKALKAEQGEEHDLRSSPVFDEPRQGGDGDLHPAVGESEDEAGEGGQRPRGPVSDGGEESCGAETGIGEG